jgi:plasmid stabilization system protein ParE
LTRQWRAAAPDAATHPQGRVDRTCRRGLAEIAAWTLAEFGSVQTRRYAGYFDVAIASLHRVDEPLDSRPAADLLPGLRRWPVPRTRHVMFYLAEGDRVLILRILHAAMDPARHLGAPED